MNPCFFSLYRGLNHHSSLISQCFDNVQWEHRLTLIQQSQRRFHGDQNTCPSNPSAEIVIQNKHGINGIGRVSTVRVGSVQLEYNLCVCYLQCTINGSSPFLLSLTELTNNRKSEGSSGTPWSGHATYCRCVTARSSPRFTYSKTHIDKDRQIIAQPVFNMINMSPLGTTLPTIRQCYRFKHSDITQYVKKNNRGCSGKSEQVRKTKHAREQ